MSTLNSCSEGIRATNGRGGSSAMKSHTGTLAQQLPPVQPLSRSGFLRRLFALLEEQDVRYCVLHSYEELPDELSSDLDLAIHSLDLNKLPGIFRQLESEGHQLVQTTSNAVGSRCFTFAWLNGPSQEAVAVDVVFEDRQAGLLLTSGEELLGQRQRRGIFWKPAPPHEFVHLLAKKTLKGVISLRQEEKLQSLVQELGDRPSQHLAATLFGERWQREVVEACKAARLHALLGKLKTAFWRTVVRRDPLSLIRFTLANTWRRFNRWRRPPGLQLVFLGPDGVGKTTLVKELADSMRPVFSRHRVFSWRPMFLPRRKSNGPNPNPHGQIVRPFWQSIGRLAFLMVDYWLGYWLVIRPFLARGGLVLFDRSFTDLLVDPRRYRHTSPPRLVRFVSALIPRPDLFLVMVAPRDVVLSRKRELPPEEVERQTETYRRLAAQLPHAVVINTNQPLEQTSADAAQAILEFLGRRSTFRQTNGRGNQGLIVQPQPAATNSKDGVGELVLQGALSQFIGQKAPSSLGNGRRAKLVSGQSTPAVICLRPSRHTTEELARQGYVRMHEFAVVPSRRTPRWLIPLGDTCTTRRALEMYSPYQPRARFLKVVLDRVVQTGWKGWARDRVLVAAHRPLPLEVLVREVTGEEAPVFALCPWPPRHYHKITIQVMRPSGEILGYIKLPFSAAASSRIQHEAAVLERLWEFPALRAHLPKVLCSARWQDSHLLFRAPGGGVPGPHRLTPMHEEFLRLLGDVQRVEKPGEELVTRVATRWERAVPTLGAEWESLGRETLRRAGDVLAGTRVPCGLGHGDFAPWNTRVENGRLFVFDWELASGDVPPGWDRFNFAIRVQSLLGKKSGQHFFRLRNKTERASFWLYLLNTVCESVEEQAPLGAEQIHFRRQILRRELA